jgi:hypothetical protein
MMEAINEIFSNICVTSRYSLGLRQKLLYIKPHLHFNI